MGGPLFVTWRLAGRLPGDRHFSRENLSDGEAFGVFDRLLDTARTGPLWLRQPAVARVVTQHVLRLAEHERMYDLHAYAVMPNHVHLLFTPNLAVEQIMMRVKGGSARLANQEMGTTGSTFWQDESYDHCVRDHQEFLRIRHYIEFNPVRAGLSGTPESFPYSSAWREHGQSKQRTEPG